MLWQRLSSALETLSIPKSSIQEQRARLGSDIDSAELSPRAIKDTDTFREKLAEKLGYEANTPYDQIVHAQRELKSIQNVLLDFGPEGLSVQALIDSGALHPESVERSAQGQLKLETITKQLQTIGTDQRILRRVTNILGGAVDELERGLKPDSEAMIKRLEKILGGYRDAGSELHEQARTWVAVSTFAAAVAKESVTPLPSLQPEVLPMEVQSEPIASMRASRPEPVMPRSSRIGSLFKAVISSVSDLLAREEVSPERELALRRLHSESGTSRSAYRAPREREAIRHEEHGGNEIVEAAGAAVLKIRTDASGIVDRTFAFMERKIDQISRGVQKFGSALQTEEERVSTAISRRLKAPLESIDIPTSMKVKSLTDLPERELRNELVKSIAADPYIQTGKTREERVVDSHEYRDGMEVRILKEVKLFADDTVSPGRYKLIQSPDPKAAFPWSIESADGRKRYEIYGALGSALREIPQETALTDSIYQLRPCEGWRIHLACKERDWPEVRTALEILTGAVMNEQRSLGYPDHSERILQIERKASAGIKMNELDLREATVLVGSGAKAELIARYLESKVGPKLVNPTDLYRDRLQVSPHIQAFFDVSRSYQEYASSGGYNGVPSVVNDMIEGSERRLRKKFGTFFSSLIDSA